MRKEKLEKFLSEQEIEPIEVSYDVEMSWMDYLREHPKIKDFGKAYDKWFKENRDWIKEVIQTMPEAKLKEIV